MIMEKAVIQATVRSVTGKKVRALRRQGQLPGVLYGHNFQPTPISMDLHDTTKILSTTTSSSIVTVVVDGKENAALIREKQRDFIKGNLKHIDFLVVSLTEKLRATVSLEFVGISPAVKDLNGILVTNIYSLQVECLPSDLPEKIEVDLGKLEKIGDVIHVKDIAIAKNIEVLDHEDEVIVVVNLLREEAEDGAEAAGAAEPEVIEKGKKEEEGED